MINIASHLIMPVSKNTGCHAESVEG